MPGPSRSSRRPLGRRTAGRAGAGAVVGVLSAVLCAGPAGAAERTVTVTADGVRPEVLTAAPGDTVRFVVEDRTFAYRAQSTGGEWSFDSGPTALLSGGYTVPSPLPATGTYSYRVAQDPPYAGTVVVTDGGRPGTSPSATPVGGATPAPAASPPAPPPSAGSPAPPAAPSTAPSSSAAPSGVAPAGAGPASLAPPATVRRLGLPAALALVLVVGTAWLLVRALLAEPVLSDPRARL